VILGSGTLITGSDGTNATFAGVISGTGGLTKARAGTDFKRNEIRILERRRRCRLDR